MGDNGGRGQWSGVLLPNGLLPREAAGVTRSLEGKRWAAAEERTAELIASIQPNHPSEERRNAVVNYVQGLIMKCFTCQVFTFGSVPLKTYLPDGDIDLTVFSKSEELKDTWANEVCARLENEEKSETAEFRVKEVQYIQAEVKIIKCLVENIVVDISFNQVGGLCTLCFLEEIDQLINQNHLFKRSIILIKAWSYYESRILGAHHGLISTYALETLVLYIFHVFNNSFAGPLEVLYRFLEFFSNFDWENFCVSLWGPVTISSLPDITAQPPRKDGGDLLLSGGFLNACSTVYAVFPGGQENQSQPFLSKHFNIIDPLRTNNNLGRSVSKGNFFRIRSAFTFGAKTLARLLDKDNPIAEVNRFFMNTWERHGSGHRPDAPSPSIVDFRPSNYDLVEEPSNSRNLESIMKKSGVGLTSGQECHCESSGVLQGPNSQVVKTINQHPQSINMSCDTRAAPHIQCQESYIPRNSSRPSEKYERSNTSGESFPIDNNKKSFQSSYSSYEGQVPSQFARTRSSPELTDTSADILSKMKQSRIANTTEEHIAPPTFDRSSRRKNLGSEVSSASSELSSSNDCSFQQTSHVLEVDADSQGASNSQLDDVCFSTMGENLAFASEALELQQEMIQEEQDFVNMMASSRVPNLNGHFPASMAHHPPFPMPSFRASINYAQRNMAGMVPTNVSMIDPNWGSNIHFPQGLFSSNLHNYFPISNHTSRTDESSIEGSGANDLNSDDMGRRFLHENDTGTNRRFDIDNSGFRASHVDDKQVVSSSSGFIHQSQTGNSGFSAKHDNKFPRELRGSVRDGVAVQKRSSKPNDYVSFEKNGNSRFSHATHFNSSITKSGFDNSRNGSTTKPPKSTRDRRKVFSALVMTSLYGRPKGGWKFESSSGHASSQDEEDEDNQERDPLITMGSNRAERSASLEPTHGTRTLPGYEQSSISGSDSLIPVTTMVNGCSSQWNRDNNTVVPFTFYPTGPPVPFFAIPVYDYPSRTGNSDALPSESERDGVDHSHTSQSNQNFNSVECVNHTNAHIIYDNPICAVAEAPDSHKPDILNGDFVSHWQNLQFGRFCQNPCYHGQLIYNPPVMVPPPIYFQGHYPIEGPGRPLTANCNVSAQFMNCDNQLVHVAPLQPSSFSPSGALHRYGEETPRFRPGTGTYLPNPKTFYRDRRSSNFRNPRGNYSYDRNDHSDREVSWAHSRPRPTSRNHNRDQLDRQSLRLDGLSIAENHSDRMLDGFKHESSLSYQTHNSNFSSANSLNTSANMPYGIYQHPGMSTNGAGPTGPSVPSVVMFYPCNQAAGMSSNGPLAPQHIEGNPVRLVEPRHYSSHRSSTHSSPDRPSSPHA